MSGTANTGDTTVVEGVKAEWMISDYKFEFRTSHYPGEMEGMRRACAILLNARSEVNIMPVEGSTREIIEVAQNIPKELDGWEHLWFNRKVTRKYIKAEKTYVDFHEVHLKIRSSWRLDSMLANQQIANALEKAKIKIFATKFIGSKPRAFIGNFIGPVPTMSNRTEIEKAVQEALLADGTMVEPEFELVRHKEKTWCKTQKKMYVAEVWGINIEKQYTTEAVAAIQRMMLSDRPPLGLRGGKFVESPKESQPVKMMRIEAQNTIHYDTVALVCDHMYAADIKFVEGLEQYFDFMDSSESEKVINMRTLLDENIGRFCKDNVNPEEAIKDMYFSRGKFHIVCVNNHSKEIMAAFQRLVTDIHERVPFSSFLEIFGIHRNLDHKYPYVEAIDSVGETGIIRNTLTFACPDDIDQTVFDQFINSKGFSQEVAQVPEDKHRCPNFTFTNKRQVIPVAIDPKLNSEKFWENNKISKKKVPDKISTGNTSKTAASSLTSKTALDKLEKKLQENLKAQELRHQKELQKITSNFELQLNQVKSDLEEATTRLNNKFTLLQNDTDQINRKIDLGFENSNSLISQLSSDVQNMVRAITNTAFKPPSPDRVRKKPKDGDLDGTQDLTMDDDNLSAIGSDDEMQQSQDILHTQPPSHSGAAHHPSNAFPNQHSQTMLNNSVGANVGGGC